MKFEASKRYAPVLWGLLFLFVLRVAGQALVYFFGVAFLPPMEKWYSGLMPYSYLLPSQAAIILLFGKVCLDFAKGEGFFVQPRPAFGTGLFVFGTLYFLAMMVRLVVLQTHYIPIFFHCVLAVFILTVGRYHRAVQ
jgi:hypothetical protein